MTAPGSKVVAFGQTAGWAVKQRGGTHTVSPPSAPLHLGTPYLNTHLILGCDFFCLAPVSTSCSCCDKRPQTGWLQTTVSSHPVLEARNPKSSCQPGMPPLRPLGENPSLPLPASGGSSHSSACAFITPVLALVFTWPHDPLTSSSVSIRTCVF